MNQITNEISQSSNIKSATTRKNVQGALRKIIQYLKVTDFNIPKTGLGLFCGNVSEQEGKTDIQFFHVVPVRELKIKTYRCDSDFFLDPLLEMLAPNAVYGIVAIDNREATIATLVGKNYKILARLGSAVPGKIKAGGQSAHRFEHLREEAAQEFYTRISEKINEIFIPIVQEGKFKGFVFGGPGATKKKMVDLGRMDYRLKDKIIGFLDNTYTDESGIKEIIDLSEDMLRESELVIEKHEINAFMEKVVKTNLATYGLNEVIEAVKTGRASKIIVSEDLKIDQASFECNTCEKHFFSSKDTTKCQYCNSEDIEELEELDAGDYFYELAKKTNTDIVFVSDDTSEGKQFYNAFGGVGAILRY
jgi:peptide chain release factor subunit 1